MIRRTAIRGVAMVLLAALAVGCSQPDTHHPAGTSHETATEPVSPATDVPSPDGVSVEITVADGAVDPPPDRVEVAAGERVTLTVTSDVDDELHVHGYDRSAELPAGETASLTFTADRPGIYEVETHETGLVLTQIEVR